MCDKVRRRNPNTRSPWLGSVPNGWELVALKHLCVGNVVYGLNTPAEAYEYEGVRFLRTTDIGEDGRLHDEGVHISARLAEGALLQTGDILLSRSGTLGRCYVASHENHPMSFAGYLVRFRPGPKLKPKYFFYLTKSIFFNRWIETEVISSTIGNINGQKYASFRIPLPPNDVQDKIVRLLDRETAEIDALIEKQERLIALLEEKRQAAISHAVTKGLDPNAPMKDSGISWLGEIPAHWDLQKLRTLVTIEKRIAGALGYDVFSITQRGLKVKDLDSADGQHSMDYSKYQIVEPGDFAMNHMDLLTGYVDLAQSQGVTSPDYRVFRLKASSSVLSRFLLLVLQDAYRRRVLYAFGQGSSTLGRWRLPSEAFYGFPVALPSQSEQLEIASEVARFEDDTEKLVSACRRAAHVLRERRASLISAAVTGKIDLTGRV